MAALSAVTLLLGVGRELVVARGLRDGGQADLFFRGLVVLGATRAFSSALFRARVVPSLAGINGFALLRRDLRSVLGIAITGLVGLVAVLGDGERWVPAAGLFAIGIVASAFAGPLRALCERDGRDVLAFASEWLLPLGTVLGVAVLGAGAFGAAMGLSVGVVGSVLLLAPFALTQHGAMQVGRPPGQLRALMLDTLLYVNLGLLDAVLSTWVYEPGAYARLNYGYLFVNAVLAVPMAAATIVALRAARAPHGGGVLRWSLLGGAVAGLGVSCLALLLRWAPVAEVVDRAAGWSIAAPSATLVLASVPFVVLRLANTIARQRIVATDPSRLIRWDVLGLAARGLLLIALAPHLGIVASPLALALAELFQLGVWWGQRRAAA